jgi:hypothetical protein
MTSPDAHKPLPSEQLNTMRTAMRAAIEQRSVPEIEDIFAQAWRLLTSAQVSELRHKREKNIKRQYASWKIALVVERLRAQWLVETGKTALRFIRPQNTKIGAPTGLITLDAKGQPPRIGIDRKKSHQLQAFARLTEKQFQTILADQSRMLTVAGILRLYAPKRGSHRVRGPMELHPITGDYDDLTGDELTTLRESLRAHGLVVPVVVWRNQIVDGRHRAKLCQELGIELRTNDISKQCSTEAEMIARVRAFNEHRRANTKPLKAAEKQARIDAALKASPERSNRQIAEGLGVDHKTVGAAREELKATGEIPQLDKHVGKDGKSRKPKPARSNKKRKPPPGIEEPSDVAQPDKPAPEPIRPNISNLELPAPESAAKEPMCSNNDAPAQHDLAPAKPDDAPQTATDQPVPTPDPWAHQRAAFYGFIIGIKSIDFDQMIAPMPREELRDAKDVFLACSAALDAAIERATPAAEQMPAA